MKDNILLTALALFLIVAITGRSCIETDQIEPQIAPDTTKGDPWDEQEQFQEGYISDDHPAIGGELLQCDEILTLETPFVCIRSLDGSHPNPSEWVTVRIGNDVDSLISDGAPVPLTNMEAIITTGYIDWFQNSGFFLDTIMVMDNFSYDQGSQLVNAEFSVVIVSSAVAVLIPTIEVFWEGVHLVALKSDDDLKVNHIAESQADFAQFKLWFEFLLVPETTAFWGNEWDSVQVHEVLEIPIDNCASGDGKTLDLRLLPPMDTVQLTTLEDTLGFDLIF